MLAAGRCLKVPSSTLSRRRLMRDLNQFVTGYVGQSGWRRRAPVTGLANSPGMRIHVVQGDITEQNVDAIVNATGASLVGGGGVSGAIHRSGGPAILAELRQLHATEYRTGLPTGQAVATTAGNLPARWVIHTVGPVHSPDEDRSELLASCYRESLRIADELGATTVAFPAISAGQRGWPFDDAARIAIGTVRATATQVADVRFVLLDRDAHTAFVNNLGPTDEEITAALAAKPAQRWRRLFDLADRLSPGDLEVRWRGGGVKEPGVFTLNHPLYSDSVQAIIESLYELGVIVSFDWPEWHRTSPLFPDAAGLTEAPVADAARLATTYVRGERFSEGAIQQSIENGALLAILNRLRRWFETERPDPDEGARGEANTSKITYRDIEAVTRQLIAYKIEADRLDTYGIMKARHSMQSSQPSATTPSAKHRWRCVRTSSGH
jgi:O-acetyl-ADP-ribose deacetylase (regulator of RNase III)